MTAERKQVAVIGSGVLGSAIALALSQKGALVNLFDAGAEFQPATQKSFGWINAHSPENAHHFRLRLASMSLWRSLHEKYPGLPLRFGGGLDWDLPPDNVEELSNLYVELGSETVLLVKEDLVRFHPHHPNLPELALHNKNEGIADPATIASSLNEISCNYGVVTRPSQTVTSLSTENNRVKAVTGTDFNESYDHVVLCAGIGTNSLLEMLGLDLPMDNLPGRLLRTNPLPKLSQLVTSSPGLHFWQSGNGSVLAGTTQAGSINMPVEDWKADMLSRLIHFFPAGTEIRIENVSEGIRPMPADAMPVAGPIPGFENASIAAMHSGITLAPAIAEAIALEIVEEKLSPELDPYRFSRFTEHDQSQLGVA